MTDPNALVFGVDPATLVGFLLALVRAAAWVALAPPFSSRVIPVTVKTGLAVALALAGAPHLAGHHPAPSLDMSWLMGAAAVQFAAGLALGFVAHLLFSAVQSAGSMLDLMGGMNLPSSLDPLSENQTPILGQLYEMIAMVLLFVSGADLILVRGFLKSFDGVGYTFGATGGIGRVLLGDVSTFFVAALEIAAPLLAVLFLVQVALGLVSRAAPQMNVFAFAFPAQIIAVLLLVGLGIRVLPGAMGHLLERTLLDGRLLFGGG